MRFPKLHLLSLIISFQVIAQSDVDFFLFPPAVPLAVEYNSDTTPVSLEFAIGSTQTLKWETTLPTYKIVGRMVLSEDGAEDLILYVKNKTDPELGTYEWTVPDPPEILPYWLYISVSGSLKCKSMPFNISKADLLHSSKPSSSSTSLGSQGSATAGAASSSFATSVSAPNDTTNGGNLDENGANASKTGPLGIALGVGLGVPFLILIVGGIYYANKHSKKDPPPPPAANQQEIKYPAMPEMVGSEYHPELYGRQVGVNRSELPVKRDMRIELPARRETLEMAAG